jgi:transposase-like protein
MVAAAVRTIFAQPDAAHVRSQLGEVTRMLAPQFPEVASMLTDASEDLLAFSAFPLAHWRKIWSTNPVRHEALTDRAEMKGLRLRAVAAAC